ncbi:MAG: hypothetical protein JHC26_09395, partial [Thermofilum sp.]|uniref:hypothetical protein n=1 Tax=Thermofilum sp. TaxID=1961369 RepID=UPI00258428FC
FEVRSYRPNETFVRVFAGCDFKFSFLEKLLGKTPFALAKHLVEDHIVPYIRYYLKTENDVELMNIATTKLLDEQDLFSNIMPKIVKLSEGIEYGIVTIKGDNVFGKMTIKNGKISEIEINHNGKILNGQEAVFDLISINSPVKVTLYEVDLDLALKTNPEKFNSLNIEKK